MSKELLEQAQWAKDTMIGKKFQNLKTSGIYYVTNITYRNTRIKSSLFRW